jgi:hypothetical protein
VNVWAIRTELFARAAIFCDLRAEQAGYLFYLAQASRLFSLGVFLENAYFRTKKSLGESQGFEDVYVADLLMRD